MLGVAWRQLADTRGPDAVVNPLDETSLNCRRARRLLEMATPMLREGLARFVAQFDNGWRDQWHVDDSAARVQEAAA